MKDNKTINPEGNAVAQHAEHPLPDAAVRPKTTLYMVVFSVWITTFGWLANFDAAFGGIVLVMEPYKAAFGTCQTVDGQQTCSITALQQSLIQLTSLFMALGGALSGITGNYIGRRGTCQMGCLLVAIGAAGMIGSEGSFVNYMVCKCIGGIGIGQLYSAAPVWGSESVSPQKRGFLMSSYNVGLALGNVGAAAICVGSSRIKNDWSWRTPISCQIPTACLLIVASFLFDESPRWQLIKGDESKARRSFARLYGASSDSEVVDLQVQDVYRHIESEHEMRSAVRWTDIFDSDHNRRTHVAVLVLLGNALTGIQFVIPYTALFLESIGIKNTYVLNVTISSCVLAGTLPGPFLTEYVGRRRSLLGGYTLMGSCMLIFAAISTGLGQSSKTAQNTLVAFLCMWAFVFGATSGPIVWVAAPEMHSIRLRTFGQSYAVGIYEIFSFGSAFWTPYMLNTKYGDMGTNVGYFYFGVTVVILALTYIFVPETGRLSLEQIDDYFSSKRPAWKTSLKLNKAIAAGTVSSFTTSASPGKNLYEL